MRTTEAMRHCTLVPTDILPVIPLECYKSLSLWGVTLVETLGTHGAPNPSSSVVLQYSTDILFVNAMIDGQTAIPQTMLVLPPGLQFPDGRGVAPDEGAGDKYLFT